MLMKMNLTYFLNFYVSVKKGESSSIKFFIIFLEVEDVGTWTCEHLNVHAEIRSLSFFKVDFTKLPSWDMLMIEIREV